jgi:hypothetical protein
LLKTKELSIPSDIVTDGMDSKLLSTNLANVSFELEEEFELYQASGGRILFAI